jgi:hypothetical protein
LTVRNIRERWDEEERRVRYLRFWSLDWGHLGVG